MAAYGMPGRSSAALPAFLDSLAATGLPFYHVPDVETMDFARNDTLTRGQEALKGLAKRFPALAVRNGMPLVLQVRAKKSEAEMVLIRQAAEISAEGHRAAMLTANPTREYELRATLEYEFTRRGAERPAYGSIVGAGVNGTTLHYMKASDPAKPGDLVVMDAAAEYRGYAADITRTIPVSGTYTAEQRQLYKLVRDARAAGRNVVTIPGPSAAIAAPSIARKNQIANGIAANMPPMAALENVSDPAQPFATKLVMLNPGATTPMNTSSGQTLGQVSPQPLPFSMMPRTMRMARRKATRKPAATMTSDSARCSWPSWTLMKPRKTNYALLCATRWTELQDLSVRWRIFARS